MSNPNLDYLTSSGRVNAPRPPTERTPLDELSVAELGSCFVNDYDIVCPSQGEDACGFTYSGPEQLQDYQLGMLVVYPECEVCGCMLEVVPTD